MLELNELQTETEVLVVGGGPTGLSASAELNHHGIENIVIEPRTYVSHTNPRAKLTNIRSMEHFRRWGLADRIREAANLPPEWAHEVVYCTRLFGDELARFDNVFGNKESELYAETSQQVPQFIVEDTLRESVKGMEASTLETGWKVESIQQDGDRVRATVVNCIERMDISQGEKREITAEYLLGCDGARSTIREEIGSSLQGDVNPRRNLGVVFRAPHLADQHEHGPAIHYWTINDDVQGFMGRLDLEDKWWMIAVGVENPEELDPEALIYEMVGEQIDATVLTTDPWSAKMLLVDRSRDGRVFLVGDAAHLNPPWGGHGYNTGVGDAVDIGWKVAAVLNGWGGSELLDTYETERRGVHEDVIDVSTENMQSSPADLVTGRLGDDDTVAEEAYEELGQEIYEKKKMEFHSLGLVLGYRYKNSPILSDEDRSPPSRDTIKYNPTTYPGARLPHSWIDRGKDHSLYDELGEDLSLLRLDESVDISPIQSAAENMGIPLEIVDLEQKQLSFEFDHSLILVRPDQHVAWRGSKCPDDPESILKMTCGISTTHSTV